MAVMLLARPWRWFVVLLSLLYTSLFALSSVAVDHVAVSTACIVGLVSYSSGLVCRAWFSAQLSVKPARWGRFANAMLLITAGFVASAWIGMQVAGGHGFFVSDGPFLVGLSSGALIFARDPERG